MANEIYVQTQLTGTKSGVTVTLSNSWNATLAGNELYNNTQSIGISDEAITVGFAVVSYIAIKNLHASNTVEIFNLTGGAAANLVCTLGAGESMVMPAPDDLWAKASADPTLIDVVTIGV